MFVGASYPAVAGNGHETGRQAANGCDPVKQVTKASDQKARYRSNDGNLYSLQVRQGLQEARTCQRARPPPLSGPSRSRVCASR